MPRQPKTSEQENAEETVVQTPAEDYSQLRDENNQLKQKLDDLTLMFQQFMQNQAQMSQQKQESAPLIQENDYDLPDISPNKMIKVTSLFYGGMTLRGSNNKPIRFENFGITLPISFEDLNYICSNHRSLAEEGSFYIHSADAIKALYLDGFYKKIVNRQTIESFITLSENQIEDIYCNLTASLQETVEDIVVQGIKNNDRKYGDRNKIDFLSKLAGKNLYKIAQEQIM